MSASPVPPTWPDDRTVDHLQATAKWLVGAFAAVFAALTAGIQIVDVGRLGIGNHWFWVAVAGIAITIASVWVAIKSTLDFLVTQPPPLRAIAKDAKQTTASAAPPVATQENSASSPARLTFTPTAEDNDLTSAGLLPQRIHTMTDGTFDSAGTVAEILIAHVKAREEIGEQIAKIRRAPPDAKTIAARINDLRDWIDESRMILSRLEARVRLNAFQNAFKGLKDTLATCGFWAVVGILVFVVGAASGGDGAKSASWNPVETTIQLNAAAQVRLAPVLGAQCVAAPLQVIVLKADREGLDLVSLPSEVCNVEQFSIRGSDQIVVDASPSPTPTAPPAAQTPTRQPLPAPTVPFTDDFLPK